MTVEQIALVLAGFSIGVAAGESYLLILRRSLRKLVDPRESTNMVWSAPGRVAVLVLALALALIAEWDHLVLAGGVVGLLLTQVTAHLSARARATRAKGFGPR